MHGCPPEEQESICHYLLTEKRLHTYVKLNPTLLGYDKARSILDNLGYDHIMMDPQSFKNDIQFADAVKMIRKLQKTAENDGLEFGVKLSNTLAVANNKNLLPGKEMYMSGRALYPLTISLAEALAVEFEGDYHDTRSESGYLKALVSFALRDPELKSIIQRLMRRRK